jgi:glyoxylase-like metal-dependent hydrolase (beta-lactamase superfamily II)
MTGIRQEVYSVRSAFVNSYIIRGQRTLIIDTGVPGFGEKVLAKMEEHGIKHSDVSLIVITHGHHDHTGSAAFLKEKTGAPVAIHRDDAEALRTGENPPLYPVGAWGAVMAAGARMMKMPRVQGMEPDLLIDSEFDLAPYGIEGKVIPTPGHTEGSLTVLLAGGCALVGDMIFGGMVRKHSPNFPYLCRDKEKELKSVQMLLDRNPKIIYAGHGGPFTAGQVWRKFFADM